MQLITRDGLEQCQDLFRRCVLLIAQRKTTVVSGDYVRDVDLDINVREGNMGTAEEEEDENLVEIDD